MDSRSGVDEYPRTMRFIPILVATAALAVGACVRSAPAEDADGGAAGSSGTASGSSAETSRGTSLPVAASTSAPSVLSSGPGAVSSSAAAPGSSAAASEVRFVALGDTGKGNDGQVQVAAAMKRKCDAERCDFALLLGDNIYESGVSSVDDPQWQEKFEGPYQALNFPFYAVLGNHDYGSNGGGLEFDKGPIEVAYSARSQKWVMPATHYTLLKGPVGFLALDTNSLLFGNTQHGDQAAWVEGALTSLGAAPWKVALGHHPYLSNGPHGNAGEYDGRPWLPVANGSRIKDFFDAHICGRVDVYLCGHDHSRQWLHQGCGGAELAISGAGAAPTDLPGSNPFYWQEATLGFLYVVVTPAQFKGQFVSVDGTVQYERVVSR